MLRRYAQRLPTDVAPRPLPQGALSDTILTVDSSVTIGWWLFEVGFAIQNLFDARYRLSEFNYASDFRTGGTTTSPLRHFTAGAPRTLMFTVAIHYGDAS